MQGLRVRAVVLAAGLATRMRPLTHGRPKALLPVLGRPLIAHTLDRLAAAGIEATAINLHHRGPDIVAALGESWRGMPLHYSEEPEILGTLGGLVALRGFLAPADLVVVVNGDSLCRWPVRELVAAHRAAGCAASLLLIRAADAAAFGPVGVDGGGRIVSFPGAAAVATVAAERVFGGAHAFSPALLEGLPEGRSDSVADLYRPGLARGLALQGVESDARWHDLGTGRRYLEAVLDWMEGGKYGRHLAPSVVVGDGATLAGCVAEDGVRIGAGAIVRRCLLLPGAVVGAGSRLEEVIVGDAVVVPAGCEIRAAVLTRAEQGRAESSVVEGDTVRTPLGVVGGRA